MKEQTLLWNWNNIQMQRCFDMDKMFLQVNICRVLYGTCNNKNRAQLLQHRSTMFLSTYSTKNEIGWDAINQKTFTIAYRSHVYLVWSSVIKQISRDSKNFRGIVERIETVYTFTTYALHDIPTWVSRGVEEGRRIRVNEAWWRTSRVAFCHRGQEKSIGQESINNNPREGKQRLFRFVDLRVAALGPARVLCPAVASDTEASRFILAKELRGRDENSLPFYLTVGSRNYTERVFLSTFVRILKVYRRTVCT